MSDPAHDNLETRPPGLSPGPNAGGAAAGTVAAPVEHGDEPEALSGSSEPALREFADRFRRLPHEIADYAVRVNAWLATAPARTRGDLCNDASAELAELTDLGMQLYHVLHDIDQKWASEARSGRLSADWEDTRKICAVYRRWSEPSEKLMSVIDRRGSTTAGDVRYAEFRAASIDAWFRANADLERLRRADEQLDRKLRSRQEGSGARSKSPDQVGG